MGSNNNHRHTNWQGGADDVLAAMPEDILFDKA